MSEKLTCWPVTLKEPQCNRWFKSNCKIDNLTLADVIDKSDSNQEHKTRQLGETSIVTFTFSKQLLPQWKILKFIKDSERVLGTCYFFCFLNFFFTACGTYLILCHHVMLCTFSTDMSVTELCPLRELRCGLADSGLACVFSHTSLLVLLPFSHFRQMLNVKFVVYR